MADTAPIHGAPRKVLLATDLTPDATARSSARSLLLLAGTHSSSSCTSLKTSTIRPIRRTTYLPSWHRPPDAVSIARQRVAQGLRADLGEAVKQGRGAGRGRRPRRDHRAHRGRRGLRADRHRYCA